MPVRPPGLDVTVYPVIDAPPLSLGAVKETVACPFPAVAETAVGAAGTVTGRAGVTAVLAEEALDAPSLFVATTVNVYAVPFVSPDTVIGELAPLPVNPPGLDVTVYPVIVAPPLSLGAVNETVACPFPAVAETAVGAAGIVLGVTAVLAVDAVPVPRLFIAATVNVYAVPFVRPVTVMGELVPVAVTPPGLDVTVYCIISKPPLSVGGVNVTVACPFPAVAETPVGANGTLAGIIAAEGADASDVPIAFVAVTMNVYEVPFVRPDTIIGEAVPVLNIDPSAVDTL